MVRSGVVGVAMASFLLLTHAFPVEVPWLCGGACASNMVLQRAPLHPRLWGVAGAAPSKAAVVITLDGTAVASGVTSGDGTWQLDLPVMEASNSHELMVTVGNTLNATLSNVAFGDVYICGGQSNMEFSMPSVYEVEADIVDSSNYPDLRLFTLFKYQNESERYTMASKTNYTWGVSSPQTIMGAPLSVKYNFGWFSAVCYYFGRETYKALDGKVPIGLVASNWGGTNVEAWSSPDALAKCDGEEVADTPPHQVGGPQRPSVLYNAMIVPLLPMRVVGEVWYQGEQNAGNPALYACRFPALIQDYRKKFNLPDFVFFYVELAAFNNAHYAELRRAQKHALKLPNVGFATAIDQGFTGAPIHSPRKKEVGRRLSLAAQGIYYKLLVTYNGPTMDKVHVSVDGSVVKAVVSFNSAADLHSHGTAACTDCCDESPFQVTFGSHTARANYSLSSSGDRGEATLTADLGIAVDNVSDLFVSLEFEGFPQCALYNGNGGPDDHAGIAASPFSTSPEPTRAAARGQVHRMALREISV